MLTRTSRGFTIVELLITIVVIGVLASVTVVAYNGIQDRAYNAQVKTMVRQYIQALSGYLALNGTYPPVPSQATPGADDRICLGEGYADHTNDSEPDCGNTDFPSIEYEAFNDALSELVSLPVVSERELSTPFQTSRFIGATLIRQDDFTVDAQPNPYYIMYVLDGSNTDCGAAVVEQVSNEDPFPSMTPSQNPWSWSDGNTTMCVVALPNPS